MNKRCVFLTTLLLISSAMAGCTEPGTEVSFEFEGEITPSSDGFEMDGYIETDGGFPPQDTYHDVTICLYAKDGTLLHDERLGNMDKYGRLNVSIIRSVTPFYILIDSPDLDNPKIGTTYMELIKSDDYYRDHPIKSPKESPVQGCV